MYTIESQDAMGNEIISFPVYSGIALQMFDTYQRCAVQHKDGRSIMLKHDGEIVLTRFAD